MDRVLVVDDEASSRLLLTELLTHQGFEVEAVDGGPGALDRLASGSRPDILLSDIHMPRMDGIELVRRAVGADPTLVGILITGWNSEEQVLAAMRAGAFDFLKKPYSADELRSVMVRASERRRIALADSGYRDRLERMVEERETELTGLTQALTEIEELGRSIGPAADPAAPVGDFARFALDRFDLDTFGVFTLEDGCFRPLVFEDRWGRPFDASALAPDSNLGRALLETGASRIEPGALPLQPANRWARTWTFGEDFMLGMVYAGRDTERRRVRTPESVFQCFRNRIEGRLREQYLGKRYQQGQRRLFVASIQAHVRSIEAKDAYTAGHCDRVERYSERIARQAGAFTEDWIFNLRMGAILHDIGKIGVPKALLCKPGDLDPDEQREVQTHPVVGGRIVRALEGLDLVGAVRHHHERFDGRGYPDRLSGDAIPMEARLILAADTFDAMTSDRPYRRALGTERALEELGKHSGTQFDPEVVEWMVDAAPALEQARLEMNEGATGDPVEASRTGSTTG